MIVYGDPSYEAELDVLIARLQTRMRPLADTTSPVTLDALRSLLIEAGQLEQAAQDALADAPEAARLGALFQAVTDWTAAALYREWNGGAVSCRRHDVAAALRGAQAVLRDLNPLPDVRVTVKLPEGYSFYALYPERYAMAAQRWAADFRAAAVRTAAVVGVRSIGTSLSALVKTVLEAEGWQARRLTVRPTGPPYERRAELPTLTELGAQWALVVDEGPGQSGSSMAAVAEAMVRDGADRSRVCFFPGHAGGPGGAAARDAREWWARAPCYVAHLGDLQWAGRFLPETLAALTPQVAGSGRAVVRVDDFGGGLWRRHLYADAAEWPVSCPSFEWPKYRCVLDDGSAVLWKYEGLAAGPDGLQTETALRRRTARSLAGWTSPPLGAGYGFVATAWLEGRSLSPRESQDPRVLARVGHYLASVMGPPPPEDERTQSVRRLGGMLYWNVWEALGEAVAERTRPASESAEAWAREHDAPAYGDGGMAPHTWLRTAAGRLVKTDSGGHDADHTVIGRQAVAWDVAGAMIEWGLDADTARPLLQAFQAAGGVLPPGDVLTFYLLAYAAFRLGQCAMSADMLAHDPHEQSRLWKAASDYTSQVRHLMRQDAAKSERN